MFKNHWKIELPGLLAGLLLTKRQKKRLAYLTAYGSGPAGLRRLGFGWRGLAYHRKMQADFKRAGQNLLAELSSLAGTVSGRHVALTGASLSTLPRTWTKYTHGTDKQTASL